MRVHETLPHSQSSGLRLCSLLMPGQGWGDSEGGWRGPGVLLEVEARLGSIGNASQREGRPGGLGDAPWLYTS